MHRTWDSRNHISANTTLCQGTLFMGNRSQPYTGLVNYVPLTEDQETLTGTKLWNSALPTKPIVDLPVMLGEIYRDGLPALPGRAGHWKEVTRSARNAGSEHLNLEFGWKPLVADLKKFAKAVTDADKIIEGYRKGANQDQRHIRALPELTQTKLYEGSFSVLPSQANVFATGGGSMETTSQKVWFTGHFKYNLPLGDDLASRLSRYGSYGRKLFGVRLTPDVVWNLTPWSWAADWFGDIGTVLENISNLGLDGLIGNDCYLMHHTRSETRCNGSVNSKGITGTLYRVYGEEWKYRVKASPFGFGLYNWEDLTIRQGAIAVSLGLSMGQRGSYQAR